MASIKGIAMNMKFFFLNDGMRDIAGDMDSGPRKPAPLDQADLRLMIYYSLTRLDPRESRLTPMINYLSISEGASSGSADQKARLLSTRLARYYFIYELYREEMMAYFSTGRTINRLCKKILHFRGW
jgi:hypothetical protein